MGVREKMMPSFDEAEDLGTKRRSGSPDVCRQSMASILSCANFDRWNVYGSSTNVWPRKVIGRGEVHVRQIILLVAITKMITTHCCPTTA